MFYYLPLHFILINLGAEHLKFNNMRFICNLMISYFFVGSGHLQELSCQSLIIFRARIFYNDLISIRQGLNHNYETMRRINVFYFVQGTGHYMGMYARFYFVIIYIEYYMILLSFGFLKIYTE
jgi:hypothetical protein